MLTGETFAIIYFNPINIEDYTDERFKNKHFYFDNEIDNYIEFSSSMSE